MPRGGWAYGVSCSLLDCSSNSCMRAYGTHACDELGHANLFLRSFLINGLSAWQRSLTITLVTLLQPVLSFCRICAWIFNDLDLDPSWHTNDPVVTNVVPKYGRLAAK